MCARAPACCGRGCDPPWQYRPGWVDAILFFTGCVLVGVSFLASFVAVVVGSTVLAAVGVAKAATLALENSEQARRAQAARLGQQPRWAPAHDD